MLEFYIKIQNLHNFARHFQNLDKFIYKNSNIYFLRKFISFKIATENSKKRLKYWFVSMYFTLVTNFKFKIH